jgi:hypothetical protein
MYSRNGEPDAVTAYRGQGVVISRYAMSDAIEIAYHSGAENSPVQDIGCPRIHGDRAQTERHRKPSAYAHCQ